MQSVHYFPRYSQKENVVTNNTLLLFLRLMEFSRSRFESFLAKLAGESDLQFDPQWLRISQQKVSRESVVDGFIAQDSIKIAIETKLGPVFDHNQLERHLSVFKNEDHKLLILLCPSVPRLEDGIESIRQAALKHSVEVLPTSFGQIMAVMREVLTDRDEDMLALLEDFADFCTLTGLISEEQYFLFTPPCGPSHLDNEELHLYYCPAERPRRAASLLGIYARREVRAIGRIAKVVTCTIDRQARSVLVQTGENLTPEERNRVLTAADRAPGHGWNIDTDHTFYLCDEWSLTSFQKTSPGGIMGHRMLDLRKEFNDGRVPSTVLGIATALAGKTWKQG